MYLKTFVFDFHASEDKYLTVNCRVDRMYHGLHLVKARSRTAEHLNSGGLPIFPFFWIEDAHSCEEEALRSVMTPFINHLDEFPVIMTASQRMGVERLRKCALST